MNKVPLGLLVSFTVLSAANSALAKLELSASYVMSGEAKDNQVPGFFDSFTAADFKTSVQTLDVDVTKTATAGTAKAGVNVKVHAEFGDLGISFVGALVGSSTGLATAQVQTVIASWEDESVIRVPGKPAGAQFIINATLDLKGELLADPAPRGDARALVYLRDFQHLASSLPNAPYPSTSPPFLDDLWGYVEEAPNSGLSINLPLAGETSTIRIRHVAFNGQPNSVGYIMEIAGKGSSGDSGQATIFKADISGSLHWGGIESVTDSLGNVIPREDWTIESASGFDYSKPFVPEPSSILLLGTALGGLLVSCGIRKIRRRDA